MLDACKQGSLEAAKDALDRGASPSARVSGKSCLRVAGESGQIDVARLLLARGADPSERIGERQNTHLHFAASTGNFGFMGLLLEHGADANARNWRGETPLHLACRGTGTFLIQDLFDAGADPRAVDAMGNTQLHVAASAGNAEVCKLLLKHGAQVNAQNRTGFTPLFNATRSGHTAVELVLLSAGADRSLKAIRKRNSSQRNPRGTVKCSWTSLKEKSIPMQALLRESRRSIRIPLLAIAKPFDRSKLGDALLNCHRLSCIGQRSPTPLSSQSSLPRTRIRDGRW